MEETQSSQHRKSADNWWPQSFLLLCVCGGGGDREDKHILSTGKKRSNRWRMWTVIDTTAAGCMHFGFWTHRLIKSPKSCKCCQIFLHMQTLLTAVECRKSQSGEASPSTLSRAHRDAYPGDTVAHSALGSARPPFCWGIPVLTRVVRPKTQKHTVCILTGTQDSETWPSAGGTSVHNKVTFILQSSV